MRRRTKKSIVSWILVIVMTLTNFTWDDRNVYAYDEVSSYKSMDVSVSYKFKSGEYESEYYSFTPKVTGYYSIHSEGSMELECVISNEENEFDSAETMYYSEKYDGLNFLVNAKLTASTKYYIKVTRMSQHDEGEQGTVYLTKRNYEDLREDSAVTFEGGKIQKCYKFTPKTTGTYSILSDGALTLTLYVHDIEDELMNAVPIMGGGEPLNNIYTELELETGKTYYMYVKNEDTSVKTNGTLMISNLHRGTITGETSLSFPVEMKNTVYTFVPSDSNIYTFCSAGNVDLDLVVKDSENNAVLTGIDIDEYGNYNCLGYLEKGNSYTVEITNMSFADVHSLDNTTEYSSTISVKPRTYTNLELNKKYMILGNTQYYYYEFTPSETGDYKIFINGSMNVKIDVYTDMSMMSEGSEIFGYTSVIIENAIKGTKYYILLDNGDAYDENEDENELYACNLKIEEIEIGNYKDIEGYFEQKEFEFKTSNSGYYTFTSTGELEVEVYVYDGDDFVGCDTNYSADGEKNFKLILKLEADKTYRVVVNNLSIDGSKTSNVAVTYRQYVTMKDNSANTFTKSDNECYYKITPDDNEYYTFYTTGKQDLSLYIVEEDDEEQLTTVMPVASTVEGEAGFVYEILLEKDKTYYIRVARNGGAGTANAIFYVSKRDYENISLNTAYDFSGVKACQYYKITPAEDNTYAFYTKGDIALMLTLDTSRDDIGSGYVSYVYSEPVGENDFYTEYALSKDTTYYIQLANTSISDKTSKFYVTKRDYKNIVAGTPATFKSSNAKKQYYKFTAKNTGYYRLYGNGELDLNLYIDEAKTVSEASTVISGGSRDGKNFDSEIKLTQGQTYYLLVVNNDYETSGVGYINIEARTYQALKVDEAATYDNTKDALYYSFTPATTGKYAFFSAGAMNLECFVDVDEDKLTYEANWSDMWSGYGDNYAITCELEKDVRYLIKVVNQDINVKTDGRIYVTSEECFKITAGTEYKMNSDYMHKYYTFTPATSGYYNIYTSGPLMVALKWDTQEENIGCSDIENENELAVDEKNIFSSQYLEANKTYYIEFVNVDSEKIGTSTLVIENRKYKDLSAETQVSHTTGVGKEYYSFVPTEDALYTLESFGDKELGVKVYDDESKMITDEYMKEAGWGDDKNFTLNIELVKGKRYYIVVTCNTDMAKESKIVMKKTIITMLELDNKSVFSGSERECCYTFVPETSGRYKFFSVGCNAFEAFLATSITDMEDNMVAIEPVGTGDGNFYMYAELEAGLKYYLKVKNQELDSTKSAGVYVSADRYTSVSIESVYKYNTDFDYRIISFTPSVTDTYVFYSTGNAALSFELYDKKLDEEGVNSLGIFNGEIDDDNFKGEVYLEAEVTYYAKIICDKVGIGATGNVNVSKRSYTQITEENAVSMSGNNDVSYYTFEAKKNGKVVLYSTGDLHLSARVYDGLKMDIEQLLVEDVLGYGYGGNNYNMEVEVTNGTTYYIAVSNEEKDATKTSKLYVMYDETSDMTVGRANAYTVHSPYKRYTFTPVTSDYYTFYSEGGLNLSVTIDDSEENIGNGMVGWDSSNGEGKNFNVQAFLNAGTTYYVLVKNEEGPIGTAANVYVTKRGYEVMKENEVSNINGNLTDKYFTFVPTKDGEYTFYSVGELDLVFEIYTDISCDAQYNIGTDSVSGYYPKNYNYTLNLEKDKTYYIRITNNDAKEADSDLYVMINERKILTEGTPSEYVGHIPQMHYTFTPDKDEYYTFSSTGVADLLVTVDDAIEYDGVGNVLLEDSCAYDDHNFYGTVYLKAGVTYYVTVMNNGNPATTASTIKVNARKYVELSDGDCDVFEGGKQEGYYKFVPEKTDVYYLVSEGDLKLSCYVDDTLEIMGTGAIGFDNTHGYTVGNFKFEYTFEAGKTYYILVKNEDVDAAKSAKVYVERRTINKINASGESIDGKKDVYYYSFTPTKSAKYLVKSEGNLDIDLRIDDSIETIGQALVAKAGDISKDDKNFRKVISLDANKTYYLTIINNEIGLDKTSSVFIDEIDLIDVNVDNKISLDVNKNTYFFTFSFDATEESAEEGSKEVVKELVKELSLIAGGSENVEIFIDKNIDYIGCGKVAKVDNKGLGTFDANTKYYITLVYKDSTSVSDKSFLIHGDHVFDSSFAWGTDNKTCTYCEGCDICDKVIFEDAKVRASVLVKPTCKKMGTTRYVATCEINGVTHTDTKDVVDVAKLVHKYTTKVVAATTTKNGYSVPVCSLCNGEDASKKAVIYAINAKSFKISSATVVYTGKNITQKISVKDSKGSEIDPKYYSVTYSANKAVGIATVNVTFKGNYAGKLAKTFSIIPKGAKITKLTAEKKSMKLQWSKLDKNVTGYKVQYVKGKKFSGKGVKTVTIKSAKTLKKTFSKLTSKKTYSVRICTYKNVKVNGKTVTLTSKWSAVKSVKVK